MRGATDADMAQEPLAGPRVEGDVERRVEQRSSSERATGHPLLTARADQPDRGRHALLGGGQHRGRGLGARHPTDVDPADRRPGRNRLALEQRNAAESRSNDEEDTATHDRHPRPRRACAAGLDDGERCPTPG